MDQNLKSKKTMTKIHTLDLNFLGIPKTIASYLIPHSHGVILVESGPGSTIHELEKGLDKYGFSLTDVTDVLLTHIHLDHAGAAGALSQQGAQVYVHEIGAPHMLAPERLIISATRIYGDRMDTLWGDFLPVPENKLTILSGDGEIEVQGLLFRYLDTPGHASHHLSYILEDTCFSGDVGGVRLPGPPFLRLPTPPPEFHIESWRESITKLKAADFTRIAPTHFGIFDDAKSHLNSLEKTLNDVEHWMEGILPSIAEKEGLREPFTEWELARCADAGLDQEILHAYSLAMPIGMGADGIWRYWHKYRAEEFGV
jgi:glyoxylase-like metal-dependent hydrolase (beta-lactamase superfamily II)